MSGHFPPGPGHWMARWHGRFPHALDVWPAGGVPVEARLRALRETAEVATRPLVCIAQGSGAALVVHALPRLGGADVRGVFLVGPPTPEALEKQGFPAELRTYPEDAPACPAMVIGSRNDPEAPLARVRQLGESWGVDVLDAGEAGAIDEASGHGPWPDGLMVFARFLGGLPET
ncbi:MAG: alpha/beta hydrolase [Methylobacteriaceae bacterium]|nr:alpha/beta hydrolase [Methylobacteriaceae bacterium]